MTSILECYNR